MDKEPNAPEVCPVTEAVWRAQRMAELGYYINKYVKDGRYSTTVMNWSDELSRLIREGIENSKKLG